MKRTAHRAALALLALLATGLLPSVVAAPTASAEPAPFGPSSRAGAGSAAGPQPVSALPASGALPAFDGPGPGVVAAYAAPVRSADGHIDAAATLDRVTALGATTYQYLVYNRAPYSSARDWADLPAFLSAASARGIAVWLYLVGPSQASSAAHPCTADSYPPFDGAYASWFTQTGRLALTSPALAAVAIDDFAYNVAERPGTLCRAFTPSVVRSLREALDAQAHRHLPLYATFYLQDLLGPRAVVDAYRGVVDGVVLPYEEVGSADGDAWVDAVTTGLSCPSAVASVSSASSARPCLTVSLPPAGQVARGAWAGARTAFTPTGTSATLSFAWSDSWTGAATDAAVAQVLLGTRVVWQADLAANGLLDRRTVTVPVTGLVAGRATTLTVRVLLPAGANNLGARAAFDTLSVQGARLGGDALVGSGWTATSTGSGLRAAFLGRIPVQWMAYAWPYRGRTPSATTLTHDLAIWRRARSVLDGVSVYQLPLDASSPGWSAGLFAAAASALR